MTDEELRQLDELLDTDPIQLRDMLIAARAEADELRVELERRIDTQAEALADQTLMKGLAVENGGVNLDLIPPREIAAVWVHCAVGMLGDAPNYSETEVKMPSVSMEISPAGTLDRYALIVQRVGKLTPHEARQRAEAERDALSAATDRVLELHRMSDATGACKHCSENDYPNYEVPWPCPTVRALDPKERT